METFYSFASTYLALLVSSFYFKLEELESIKIMRNLYILTVFTVILGSWNLCASAQNVDFPDANLAAAVRISLGLAEDADIPLTSLQELTQLHADNFEITNLIGLEKATSAVSSFC